MTDKLSTSDHDRDVVGLRYIYPVMSRRAGGLSIGVNFNTNNACNWRCIYCQVPGLSKGSAPVVDLDLLAEELTFFLHDVLHGSFYERFQITESQRIIRDISISGNGEPSSLSDFADALALIGNIVQNARIPEKNHFVLITNGSLIHQPKVQQGLTVLRRYHGEVWFKLDSATRQGRIRVNNAAITSKIYRENLLTATKLCPTWLQTCLFHYRDEGFSPAEQEAYLDILRDIRNQVDFRGVLLYTVARPSLQPEAEYIAKFREVELTQFAEKIAALGVVAKVST